MILALAGVVLLIFFTVWFLFYQNIEPGDKEVNKNAYVLAAIFLVLSIVFTVLHIVWMIAGGGCG